MFVLLTGDDNWDDDFKVDLEWLGGERKDLPPHWEQLIDDVGRARTRHETNPARPLHKIGRFDAVLTLATGGFGLVFDVRDPELDRHVALKLCLTRGPKAAAAITREAQLLAKLSHPNVVAVYETGRYGSDVFFVMELVGGSTGHEFIHDHPRWHGAVDLYRGAGSGLAAAHDAQIIHRDFKPANILIDKRRWPRVADFGLAHLVGHAAEEKPGSPRYWLGTLPYMAPEVLEGAPGDARSDQWSFCVSLWQTLEGVRPFEGESVEELLAAIERGEPTTTKSAAEVPAELRSLLRVGLAREPSDRYPDMHALVRELGKLTKPGSVELAKPEVLAKDVTPRDFRDDRSARGVVGAVVGLMLGSLVTGLLLWPGDARRSAPTVRESKPMAVVEIDPVVREVSHLIWIGELDQASQAWEAEFSKRDVSALPVSILESLTPEQAAEIEAMTYRHASKLAHDTLLIARIFMYRAEILERIDPIGARHSAKCALEWASGSAVLLAELGEDNAEANDLAKRARQIASVGAN